MSIGIAGSGGQWWPLLRSRRQLAPGRGNWWGHVLSQRRPPPLGLASDVMVVAAPGQGSLPYYQPSTGDLSAP